MASYALQTPPNNKYYIVHTVTYKQVKLFTNVYNYNIHVIDLLTFFLQIDNHDKTSSKKLPLYSNCINMCCHLTYT